MNIDSIKCGYVLDHIRAGKSMEIYKYLELDKLDCCVAIIKNVKSSKMGRKDIIKIDDEIDINLDILGYIDQHITVNKIKDGVIIEKSHLELPEKLVNIIRCKNPRCITAAEHEIDHIFKLSNKKKGIYRCAYCEAENGR